MITLDQTADQTRSLPDKNQNEKPSSSSPEQKDTSLPVNPRAEDGKKPTDSQTNNGSQQSAGLNLNLNLNWTPYLKDEKVAQDKFNFQKWDKGLIPADKLIEKDLPRTRADLPLMKDPRVQKMLRDIAAFYCVSNNVEYQQGLLEIVAPFLLFKTKDFHTADCYAYFNSFMRKYFPNILTPKTINHSMKLPHLTTALTFCELMIQYHLSEIGQGLTKNMVDVRTFVTAWIMTLFTKGTPIKLVFEIFDYYIKREDKLFFFYLVVGLLAMNEKTILKLIADDDNSMLIKYLNQSIKAETLVDSDSVKKWFEMADTIKKTTPKSLEIYLNCLGFTGDAFLSLENIKELLDCSRGKILYVYPSEIIAFIRTQKEQPAKTGDREINFKILDLRKNKEGKCIPYSIDMPSKIYKDHSLVVPLLQTVLVEEKNSHICLMVTGDEDKEENEMAIAILEFLITNNKNYLSMLLGGYNSLIAEMEKKKVTQVIEDKSIFQKFKEIFFK